MANCFQLFPKGSTTAISLNKLDEEICEILNVPVHPKHYGGGFVEGAFNWFDTIGFTIAMGKSLEEGEVREHYRNSDLWQEELPVIEKILDYLEENYTSYSFASR